MLAIIVAYSKENRVIGCNGKIPWNIPEDLLNFKELTTGNAIIMGRKTFESIGHALSNRLNIIVSSKFNIKTVDCISAYNLQNAINLAKQNNYKNIFICGGESLYKESINLCDRLFITEIKGKYNGDVFFPKIDINNYNILEKKEHLLYDYITLEKIK